jgi:hypothetical protein
MAGVGAISVAVNTYGATVVVNENLNRKQLWLQNMSANGQVIYLATGSGSPSLAIPRRGVRLNPGGGMWMTAGTGWIVAVASSQPDGLITGWEL